MRTMTTLNVQEALACIALARRAAQEINNILVNAESWVQEASEPGNHGHLITARHHVDEAQKHALRALGYCCEASTELRLATNYAERSS